MVESPSADIWMLRLERYQQLTKFVALSEMHDKTVKNFTETTGPLWIASPPALGKLTKL